MYKTRDGRFIEKRVELPEKIIKFLIDDYKKRNNITWKKFAEKIGVSEDTLRIGWRKKRNTIPFSIFQKILNLHPDLKFESIKENINFKEPFWGQRTRKISESESNKFEISSLNFEKFAELYGIMLGDGCIYSDFSGICISGDSLFDNYYIQKYVHNLIEELFGVKPHIYFSKKERSIRCVLYSKKIVMKFVELGFPQGKKKNSNIKIPEFLLKEDKLIKSCLRGMMDTDGSIYPHPNAKVILDLSIKHVQLLKLILDLFQRIGFPIKHTHNRIYMCGKEKVDYYFRCIGSSNPKHVLKYLHFLSNGKVPTSKDMEIFLRKEESFHFRLPFMGP